jgi:hypothetical protein
MTTLYLKITDSNNRSRIESREAWDCDKFLASIANQYIDDKTNPCRVEVVTREDYLRSIKR